MPSSLEYEDFEIEEEIVTNDENEDPADRSDILKKLEIMEENAPKTPTKPFEPKKSPQPKPTTTPTKDTSLLESLKQHDIERKKNR